MIEEKAVEYLSNEYLIVSRDAFDELRQQADPSADTPNVRVYIEGYG